MKYKRLLISLFFMLVSAAHGETLSPQSQQEINYLFSYLAQSGCEFNRNGTWHSAHDASAHLRKKYDYLERKNLLSSAEDFIVGAASTSSMSKSPYQVRCPQTPVMESGPWFTNVLEQYRQSRKP